MKKQSILLIGSIILAVVMQAQVRITSTAPPVSTTPATSNVVVGNTSYLGTAGTGTDNTFIGNSVGSSANTGGANTFVGQGVGASNTTGLANTFLGAWTGVRNTTASTNTFVGQYCGYYTTTGGENTFVGQGNGTANTTGFGNTFIGRSVGANSTGQNNTFLGRVAGNANTSGSNNLALGAYADFASGGLNNATAIGYNAKVATSNAMILGGTNTEAVNVGIGITAPNAHLHLFTPQPENVIFSTNNTGASAASTLKLQTLTSVGGLQNGLDLSVSAPSMVGNVLTSIALTSVPALPRNNIGSVTTTSVPLMIGINGYENVSHNIHFINSIKNNFGSFIPTECMRINKDNGFVGIHSRTANSSAGTGNPQALLHVNLTNIISSTAAAFNPLLNGIRFEGLPAANHPDVVVIDALGNLATRPYVAGGGSGNIPCDSVIKCAWGLQGNTINPTDFIGTNKADDFRFKTNALLRGRVTVDGNWDFGANTFTSAVTASAMGSNNFIGFSTAALASGVNNRIGATVGSDHAAAIGYQNTIDGSYAASAIGAKNDIRNNSLFASALGTINVLDNAEASHTVGTNNTIFNSNSAIALGGLNKINNSNYAFVGGGGNIIQDNSHQSGAIGNNNSINQSTSSFAAGERNNIVGSGPGGSIALGGGNVIQGSNESAAIGENNTITSGHGTIIAGGHNTTDGNYNLVLGSWSHGVSGMPRVTPHTPLGKNIMVVGEQITNSLDNSLTMGFNANRTMVITERGVAIQMDPVGTFTFAPTHNLIVDADPAIGGSGVGSNIAFQNLPVAPYPMPMVLVDANGELYQSRSTAFRVAASSSYVIADSKVEKDIKPISNALGIINQIAPKQFTIAATQYPTLALPSGKASFGFVAQELEKVLPSLISEVPVDENKTNGKDYETVKGINYMEMIPILVQALKEQQAQINSQQNQITALLAKDNRSNDLSFVEKEALTTISIQLSDADVILLQQNVPNPGDRFTAIGFNIPTAVKSASLLFANVEGKAIKTVNITARGKGIFNLNTSGLSKGVYTYTLIADGKTIDTKQMVIGR